MKGPTKFNKSTAAACSGFPRGKTSAVTRRSRISLTSCEGGAQVKGQNASSWKKTEAAAAWRYESAAEGTVSPGAVPWVYPPITLDWPSKNKQGAIWTLRYSLCNNLLMETPISSWCDWYIYTILEAHMTSLSLSLGLAEARNTRPQRLCCGPRQHIYIYIHVKIRNLYIYEKIMHMQIYRCTSKK